MQPALATALTPFGRAPPRTVRDFDTMIDHFVSLKESHPANPRIDAVLHAFGCALRNTIIFDDPTLRRHYALQQHQQAA